MTSKPALPLHWLIGGFVFLIAVLVGAWKTIIMVYSDYGAIAAVASVVGFMLLFKFVVSPLAVRFLRSRRRAS